MIMSYLNLCPVDSLHHFLHDGVKYKGRRRRWGRPGGRLPYPVPVEHKEGGECEDDGRRTGDRQEKKEEDRRRTGRGQEEERRRTR